MSVYKYLPLYLAAAYAILFISSNAVTLTGLEESSLGMVIQFIATCTTIVYMPALFLATAIGIFFGRNLMLLFIVSRVAIPAMTAALGFGYTYAQHQNNRFAYITRICAYGIELLNTAMLIIGSIGFAALVVYSTFLRLSTTGIPSWSIIGISAFYVLVAVIAVLISWYIRRIHSYALRIWQSN